MPGPLANVSNPYPYFSQQNFPSWPPLVLSIPCTLCDIDRGRRITSARQRCRHVDVSPQQAGRLFSCLATPAPVAVLTATCIPKCMQQIRGRCRGLDERRPGLQIWELTNAAHREKSQTQESVRKPHWLVLAVSIATLAKDRQHGRTCSKYLQSAEPAVN